MVVNQSPVEDRIANLFGIKQRDVTEKMKRICEWMEAREGLG
jgi:hypothetical protein